MNKKSESVLGNIKNKLLKSQSHRVMITKMYIKNIHKRFLNILYEYNNDLAKSQIHILIPAKLDNTQKEHVKAMRFSNKSSLIFKSPKVISTGLFQINCSNQSKQVVNNKEFYFVQY